MALDQISDQVEVVMSDEAPKKQPLSEISHLFLSNVRDMSNPGKAKPKRTPPKSPKQRTDGAERESEGSDDLSPEEAAQVLAGFDPAEEAAVTHRPPRPQPPVTAVIGPHLNGKQLDRVREYARHLAADGTRIGLIELDGSEFRLMCFEAVQNGQPPAQSTDDTPTCCDPRQMAEAIEEMNCDVDRWLLLLPSPRLPEARALLRLVDHWVLLSNCDHEGVVASYRTLKGLLDTQRPRTALALLDVASESEMLRVYRKLHDVCEQFLEIKLESESPVRRAHRVADHVIVLHRPHRDKSQVANAPQWPIVADFLARVQVAVEHQRQADAHQQQVRDQIALDEEQATAKLLPSAEPANEEANVTEAPAAIPAQAAPVTPMVIAPQPAAAVGAADEAQDVLDLPSAQATPEMILSAVLQGKTGTYVECPLRPPMCAEARLAVGRDRSLLLFAVAREGLGDLRSIGKAYQWVMENLPLISMAMPQLAIDIHRLPSLRLLVDHADLTADTLRPMIQSDHVTVQSYRKLRWGGKTGLLLEAA